MPTHLPVSYYALSSTIAGWKISLHRIYYPNDDLNGSCVSPISYTHGFWLKLTLDDENLPKVTVSQTEMGNYTIKIFMASSCKFPYLLKGNLVGVSIPTDGDAIAINLGQQIEIVNETMRAGNNLDYPRWHPLTGRRVQYDQEVCRKICKRVQVYQEHQVGLFCNKTNLLNMRAENRSKF